jgi:hypothetical protein
MTIEYYNQKYAKYDIVKKVNDVNEWYYINYKNSLVFLFDFDGTKTNIYNVNDYFTNPSVKKIIDQIEKPRTIDNIIIIDFFDFNFKPVNGSFGFVDLYVKEAVKEMLERYSTNEK